MNRDQRDSHSDVDDFWNIEHLIPEKKQKAPPSFSRPASRVEATEIEFSSKDKETPPSVLSSVKIDTSSVTVQNASPKATYLAPETVYSPRHPLISQVRIYPWRNQFHFYERFCEMADLYFDRKADVCDAVPFFSYMPQYDQMNRAQLNWYFYWRDCVRKGQYPDTDYSYIFLYLFEIINLPDRVSPSDGQILLCEIWKRYRKAYPLLNRYLADWICDYSLIHRLSPPTQYLSELLPVIAECSTFKEFYACPGYDGGMADAMIYLTFCTNYNYKKSKLYLSGDEKAASMDTCIPGAISHVIEILGKEQSLFSRTNMQKATLSRDSFVGALCSGRVKRRLEVEYCSFHRSHELRFLITDIIKYAENKIRAQFGMKSRLTVYALPDTVKRILDEYFAQMSPQKKKTEQERPSYEALYDAPTTGVSLHHAEEIERSSWQMTKELVEAFDEPICNDVTLAPITPITASVVEAEVLSANELATALSDYKAFLKAIDQKDVATQKNLARQKGVLPHALVEQINLISNEILGDILIDEDNNMFVILEYYRQEILSLLQE